MPVQEKPGRGDSRALMWLGHNSIRVTFVYVAFVIASNASGEPPVLTWPASVVAMVWIVSVVTEMGYHDERLCEKCIGATPLNVQAAVDRWRPALRARHTPGFQLAVAVVIVGGTVATVFTPRHHTPWWVYAVNIAIVVVMAAYFGVLHVHRRLFPWCPWCRWEGGGDAEISPDVPTVPQEV